MRAFARGGAVRRNVECDFAPRDWAERTPAGIAKIEACTCPIRKGRTFYSSSRSSYSFFVSSFSSSLRDVYSPPFCLSRFVLGTSRAFLPLSFVSVIRSSPFSPRPFCCLSLSLFLPSSSSSATELCEFISSSCMMLLSASLSIFFPLHAVWSCTL